VRAARRGPAGAAVVVLWALPVLAPVMPARAQAGSDPHGTAGEPGAANAAAVASAPSPLEVHGHLKTTLSLRRFRAGDLAAQGGRDLADALLDARLNLEARPGRWDLVAQLQLAGDWGDSPRRLRDPVLGPLVGRTLAVPAADEPSAWLDLDRTLSDRGGERLIAGFDRLSAGYAGDHLVWRLGRQALSWGDGLVFSVLDLFDPFPPNAADTEYKPGTDMLWGQWLLASGDDLQALVVPRRDPATGGLRRERSSLAAKWHHVAGGIELQLMAARHFDDDVLGLGASCDLAGGVLRFDLTWTRLADSSTAISALINLDHSWDWRGKNVYGFVELYRNGFGATDLEGGVAALDPALVDRLERGEVFAVGRDEAAAGARLEVTPLTSVEPTLIANAHDGSGVALLRLGHSLGDELRLDLGLQVPWGNRGSEYGGLPVSVSLGERRLASPGTWLWVRLARYF
jgi:hypothetical protein